MIVFRIVSKTPNGELEVEYWHKNISQSEIASMKTEIKEYYALLGRKDVKITSIIENGYEELEFI